MSQIPRPSLIGRQFGRLKRHRRSRTANNLQNARDVLALQMRLQPDHSLLQSKSHLWRNPDVRVLLQQDHARRHAPGPGRP